MRFLRPEELRSTKSANISSYLTGAVSGLIVLLNIPTRDKKILNLTFCRLEFTAILRKLPYLDRVQDVRFVPGVESQCDNQKFNIRCLVFHNISYILFSNTHKLDLNSMSS